MKIAQDLNPSLSSSCPETDILRRPGDIVRGDIRLRQLRTGDKTVGGGAHHAPRRRERERDGHSLLSEAGLRSQVFHADFYGVANPAALVIADAATVAALSLGAAGLLRSRNSAAGELAASRLLKLGTVVAAASALIWTALLWRCGA